MDQRARLGRRAAATLAAALVAVTAVVAFGAAPAAAAGPVDQEQAESGYAYSIGISDVGEWVMAQTFVAGQTGDLDQVDVWLRHSHLAETPSEDPVVVEIRTASGNRPTDTVLATASVPAGDIPLATDMMVDIHVPIGPVPVTAGGSYAIVLTSDGDYSGGFTPPGPGGDHYTDGVLLAITPYTGPDYVPFCGEDCDLAFRTYVTPAAPQLRPCKLLDLPFVLLQRLLRLPAYCA